MASTIRHNRARGTHSIELMCEIVSELTQAGMTDSWIQKHIGMDKDELLRLKQISGLASLFANKEFSIPINEKCGEMTYMIISDIHGSEIALKRALAQYERLGCDGLIILGDILYHGPRNPLPEGHNPKGVAELLNQYSAEIIAVRGNCEAEVDQWCLISLVCRIMH